MASRHRGKGQSGTLSPLDGIDNATVVDKRILDKKYN